MNNKKRGTDKLGDLDKQLFNTAISGKNISYLDKLFSLNFINKSFTPQLTENS